MFAVYFFVFILVIFLLIPNNNAITVRTEVRSFRSQNTFLLNTTKSEPSEVSSTNVNSYPCLTEIVTDGKIQTDEIDYILKETLPNTQSSGCFETPAVYQDTKLNNTDCGIEKKGGSNKFNNKKNSQITVVTIINTFEPYCEVDDGDSGSCGEPSEENQPPCTDKGTDQDKPCRSCCVDSEYPETPEIPTNKPNVEVTTTAENVEPKISREKKPTETSVTELYPFIPNTSSTPLVNTSTIEILERGDITPSTDREDGDNVPDYCKAFERSSLTGTLKRATRNDSSSEFTIVSVTPISSNLQISDTIRITFSEPVVTTDDFQPVIVKYESSNPEINNEIPLNTKVVWETSETCSINVDGFWPLHSKIYLYLNPRLTSETGHSISFIKDPIIFYTFIKLTIDSVYERKLIKNGDTTNKDHIYVQRIINTHSPDGDVMTLPPGGLIKLKSSHFLPANEFYSIFLTYSDYSPFTGLIDMVLTNGENVFPHLYDLYHCTPEPSVKLEPINDFISSDCFFLYFKPDINSETCIDIKTSAPTGSLSKLDSSFLTRILVLPTQSLVVNRVINALGTIDFLISFPYGFFPGTEEFDVLSQLSLTSIEYAVSNEIDLSQFTFDMTTSTLVVPSVKLPSGKYLLRFENSKMVRNFFNLDVSDSSVTFYVERRKPIILDTHHMILRLYQATHTQNDIQTNTDTLTLHDINPYISPLHLNKYTAVLSRQIQSPAIDHAKSLSVALLLSHQELNDFSVVKAASNMFDWESEAINYPSKGPHILVTKSLNHVTTALLDVDNDVTITYFIQAPSEIISFTSLLSDIRVHVTLNYLNQSSYVAYSDIKLYHYDASYGKDINNVIKLLPLVNNEENNNLELPFYKINTNILGSDTYVLTVNVNEVQEIEQQWIDPKWVIIAESGNGEFALTDTIPSPILHSCDAPEPSMGNFLTEWRADADIVRAGTSFNILGSLFHFSDIVTDYQLFTIEESIHKNTSPYVLLRLWFEKNASLPNEGLCISTYSTVDSGLFGTQVKLPDNISPGHLKSSSVYVILAHNSDEEAQIQSFNMFKEMPLSECVNWASTLPFVKKSHSITIENRRLDIIRPKNYLSPITIKAPKWVALGKNVEVHIDTASFEKYISSVPIDFTIDVTFPSYTNTSTNSSFVNNWITTSKGVQRTVQLRTNEFGKTFFLMEMNSLKAALKDTIDIALFNSLKITFIAKTIINGISSETEIETLMSPPVYHLSNPLIDTVYKSTFISIEAELQLSEYSDIPLDPKPKLQYSIRYYIFKVHSSEIINKNCKQFITHPYKGDPYKPGHIEQRISEEVGNCKGLSSNNYKCLFLLPSDGTYLVVSAAYYPGARYTDHDWSCSFYKTYSTNAVEVDGQVGYKLQNFKITHDDHYKKNKFLIQFTNPMIHDYENSDMKKHRAKLFISHGKPTQYSNYTSFSVDLLDYSPYYFNQDISPEDSLDQTLTYDNTNVKVSIDFNKECKDCILYASLLLIPDTIMSNKPISYDVVHRHNKEFNQNWTASINDPSQTLFFFGSDLVPEDICRDTVDNIDQVNVKLAVSKPPQTHISAFESNNKIDIDISATCGFSDEKQFSKIYAYITVDRIFGAKNLLPLHKSTPNRVTSRVTHHSFASVMNVSPIIIKGSTLMGSVLTDSYLQSKFRAKLFQGLDTRLPRWSIYPTNSTDYNLKLKNEHDHKQFFTNVKSSEQQSRNTLNIIRPPSEIFMQDHIFKKIPLLKINGKYVGKTTVRLTSVPGDFSIKALTSLPCAPPSSVKTAYTFGATETIYKEHAIHIMINAPIFARQHDEVIVQIRVDSSLSDLSSHVLKYEIIGDSIVSSKMFATGTQIIKWKSVTKSYGTATVTFKPEQPKRYLQLYFTLYKDNVEVQRAETGLSVFEYGPPSTFYATNYINVESTLGDSTDTLTFNNLPNKLDTIKAVVSPNYTESALTIAIERLALYFDFIQINSEFNGRPEVSKLFHSFVSYYKQIPGDVILLALATETLICSSSGSILDTRMETIFKVANIAKAVLPFYINEHYGFTQSPLYDSYNNNPSEQIYRILSNQSSIVTNPNQKTDNPTQVPSTFDTFTDESEELSSFYDLPSTQSNNVPSTLPSDPITTVPSPPSSSSSLENSLSETTTKPVDPVTTLSSTLSNSVLYERTTSVPESTMYDNPYAERSERPGNYPTPSEEDFFPDTNRRSLIEEDNRVDLELTLRALGILKDYASHASSNWNGSVCAANTGQNQYFEDNMSAMIQTLQKIAETNWDSKTIYSDEHAGRIVYEAVKGSLDNNPIQSHIKSYLKTYSTELFSDQCTLNHHDLYHAVSLGSCKNCSLQEKNFLESCIKLTKGSLREESHGLYIGLNEHTPLDILSHSLILQLWTKCEEIHSDNHKLANYIVNAANLNGLLLETLEIQDVPQIIQTLSSVVFVYAMSSSLNISAKIQSHDNQEIPLLTNALINPVTQATLKKVQFENLETDASDLSSSNVVFHLDSVGPAVIQLSYSSSRSPNTLTSLYNGIFVQKNYYKCTNRQTDTCNQLVEIFNLSDLVKVSITITVQENMKSILVTDYLTGGASRVNPDVFKQLQPSTLSRLSKQNCAVDLSQISTIQWFCESISRGTLSLEYFVTVNSPGSFANPPVYVYNVYQPSIFGISTGQLNRIRVSSTLINYSEQNEKPLTSFYCPPCPLNEMCNPADGICVPYPIVLF